jgi:hypothetical protein
MMATTEVTAPRICMERMMMEISILSAGEPFSKGMIGASARSNSWDSRLQFADPQGLRRVWNKNGNFTP